MIYARSIHCTDKRTAGRLCRSVAESCGPDVGASRVLQWDCAKICLARPVRRQTDQEAVKGVVESLRAGGGCGALGCMKLANCMKLAAVAAAGHSVWKRTALHRMYR